MSKTKVVLRVKTKGRQVGDTIEVDAEIAEQLVADGQAFRVAAKRADPKPDA